MEEGKTQDVYLALGSNLGDRVRNLDTAKRHLSPQVEVVDESTIYETDPWGVTDQPDFLNQVVKVVTSLSPTELLPFLKDIEKRMGREDTIKYGPRVIDLDILSYGDRVIKGDQLEIPHPRMSERAFVLVPLMEIAPDWEHPVLNKSVEELVANLDQSGVRAYSP